MIKMSIIKLERDTTILTLETKKLLVCGLFFSSFFTLSTMTMKILLSLLTFLCWYAAYPVEGAVADIVAIAPDRSTAYPNGLHNGLWLSAKRLNLTLEVRDVGNFDPALSAKVLQEAIDSPEQPKVYCIWPVDFPSRYLLKKLWETHGVPIIQMNQLPGKDSQWEWDHLLGYAGPDDALRARNAGLMLLEAFPEPTKTQVVALGYPETYGGYHLSIAAFADSLDGSNVKLIERLPLDWGTQTAYEAVLNLMERYTPAGSSSSSSTGDLPKLHAIYAMDDSILMGAYQALLDLGLEPGKDVILVGTVCNGARELLESGAQYGTTVQGPVLEGKLAIGLAHEYLTTGKLQENIHFTPNRKYKTYFPTRMIVITEMRLSHDMPLSFSCVQPLPRGLLGTPCLWISWENPPQSMTCVPGVCFTSASPGPRRLIYVKTCALLFPVNTFQRVSSTLDTSSWVLIMAWPFWPPSCCTFIATKRLLGSLSRFSWLW